MAYRIQNHKHRANKFRFNLEGDNDKHDLATLDKTLLRMNIEHAYQNYTNKNWINFQFTRKIREIETSLMKKWANFVSVQSQYTNHFDVAMRNLMYLNYTCTILKNPK